MIGAYASERKSQAPRRGEPRSGFDMSSTAKLLDKAIIIRNMFTDFSSTTKTLAKAMLRSLSVTET